MLFCVDNIGLLPYNDAHRTEQRQHDAAGVTKGSYKIQ